MRLCRGEWKQEEAANEAQGNHAAEMRQAQAAPAAVCDTNGKNVQVAAHGRD